MMTMTGMMKLDDNMSNLTSASNEASEVNCTNLYPHGQLPFAISPNQPPLAKKKRNLPGNPDPEAEVVALSPKTLIATNRFMCEICNKGFQRDQNLQLHRRGHNLPWKLKQRSNKEVRKKVYVCPEVTCVHHDPSRALGDLTGIKKHFFRKHGEKRWKCEKCSKRYAVQSDWKAHSKVCGTREYRCDCGTLFSRRDSFITHRAFCDALAQETASKDKSQYYFNPQNHQLHNFPLKPEPQDPHPQLGFNPIRPHLPPWLTTPNPNPNPLDLSTQVFYSPSLDHLDHPSFHNPHDQKNPSPPSPSPLLPSFQPTPPPPPHMSATALLQKAAQMGAVTRGKLSSTSETILTTGPHQADHVSTSGITAPPAETETTAGSSAGLGFGSRDQERGGGSGFLLSPHGCMEQVGATMMMGSLSSTCGGGFGGPSSSSFEEALNGMFSNKMRGGGGGVGVGGGSRSGGDGLTRDFLGLRAFSHGGFPNMAGFDQMNSSSSNSYDKLSQNQIPPWQG